MDNNLGYWIIEYVKVFLSYGFLMFIWPSAVFRKYLKGKSVTMRFGFCVSVQVVVISTVVLMLGLLHILNRWTMWAFFYGVLIWSYRDTLKLTKERRQKFKYLVTGTFGVKHFMLLCKNKLVRGAKRTWSRMWNFYQKHWLEYTLLIVTVIYGMIYFSWGVFLQPSYAFSDMYTHHSWIYQLSQGVPFSSGIYPEGMHCVVYAAYALFGIRIYSCLLFFPTVNIAVILIAAYCFLKEIFKWRYSSLFVMIILLTLNLGGVSMARLQCGLPQEFAFPQVLLCALFLVRYLKSNKRTVRKGKEMKGCWDENLLVFLLAFAATIIVHFYATIMAFFLCLGIAMCCWKRVFSRAHFSPLVSAVIVGLVVAILPMGVGVASGIRLQGSLYWGMSVIQGSTSSSEEENITDESIQGDVEGEINVNVPEMSGNGVSSDESSNQEISDKNIYAEQNVSRPEKSFIEKVVEKIDGFYKWLKEKCSVIYRTGYQGIYGLAKGRCVAVLTVGILVAWMIYRLVIWLIHGGKKKIDKGYLNSYLMVVFMSFIYILSYVAENVGLPMFLDGTRTGFFTHLLIAMVVVVPLDFIYNLLSLFCMRWILSLVSLATSVGIVAIIWCTGSYHGYLYFELTRYKATVEVTNKIIEELPENTYTIVSPTEELYQVIEYGRHEELLDFCSMQGASSYTLPTEYVFIFVEKKPFHYAQFHYFDGPRWLAWGKEQSIYDSNGNCIEYVCGDISEEAAEKEIAYFSKASDSYMNIASRIILQSKIYSWCETFEKLYPNEMRIFYEDEHFVCYYFRQNTQHLYNLVIE